MDPNAQDTNPQQATPVRPMNEPHLPITQAEMNPNMHQDSPKSSKNMLLTLASLLVLVGIVGITLYLYIQNKSAQLTSKTPVESTTPKNNTSEVNNGENNNPEDVKEINGMKVAGVENQRLVEKYGAICKRFTSIEEALKEAEVACTLDLSGQNLTNVPEDVYKLENLTDLNLSNNKLTKFPVELLKIKTLAKLNLSNNNISSIENSVEIPFTVQDLSLIGNNLSDDVINKYKRTNSGEEFIAP